MFTLVQSGSATSITRGFEDKEVHGAYGAEGVKTAKKMIAVLNEQWPNHGLQITFRGVDLEHSSPAARFVLEGEVDTQKINAIFGEHFGTPTDGYRPVLVHSDSGPRILLERVELE